MTNNDQAREDYFAITPLGIEDGSIGSERHSNFLVEWGLRDDYGRVEKSLLIDAGPNIIRQLKQVNTDIYNLEGIIITHTHSDHSYGFEKIVRSENFLHSMKVSRKPHLLATKKVKEVLYNHFIDFLPTQWDGKPAVLTEDMIETRRTQLAEKSARVIAHLKSGRRTLENNLGFRFYYNKHYKSKLGELEKTDFHVFCDYTELSWDKTINLNGLNITPISNMHGDISSIGVILEHSGRKVYISGDKEPYPNILDKLDSREFDLIFHEACLPDPSSFATATHTPLDFFYSQDFKEKHPDFLSKNRDKLRFYHIPPEKSKSYKEFKPLATKNNLKIATPGYTYIIYEDGSISNDYSDWEPSAHVIKKIGVDFRPDSANNL